MTKNARALLWSTLVVGTAMTPVVADAHFVLEDPPSWHTQDAGGSPQKLGPCGNETGGTDTGTVTAFQTGSTITVTIHETVFHPGHYRVALALHDRSELPPEPTVTPGVGTPCGTVPIQDPPVFPVLADGMLVHTMPMSGPQSFQVPLPAGMTCDHCTLQIIEFMSQHPLNNPGGCFYHHCADISIQDVVVTTDAGTTGADTGPVTGTDSGATAHDSGSTARDAGSATPPPQACACSAPGRLAGSPNGALALIVIAGIVTRLRRKR